MPLKCRLFVFGIACGCFLPAVCLAQGVYGSNSTSPNSFTSSIKQGFNKVGSFFLPKSKEPAFSKNDPVALSTPGKPSVKLYTALARLAEEDGNSDDAERYFQMALKLKPDDLKALLFYARIQENRGSYNKAIALYQRAVQTHPKEPSVYNNLGLCQARQKSLNEAVQAFTRAVQLNPRSLLFRNNLAAVLVEQNRLSEAFANLREVHGDATAYYNLGYLLNKKGDIEAAEHHFAQALRANPKMVAAQKWLNYLHDKSRQSRSNRSSGSATLLGSLNNSPSHFPAKVISPQTQKTRRAAMLTTPTRLPPLPAEQNDVVAPREAVSGGATLSHAPPMPPEIVLPQLLPPISLHQPNDLKEGVPISPNFSGMSSVAPLPPVTRR
ncbi:MAG: tetratricopeptide repeat protein [Thermoguttaceae bacterium]